MIALGCDQAGSVLRDAIIDELREAGLKVIDVSPTPALDYPDVAEAVAKAVSAGEVDLGILACGTGVGMSITANKVKGVRAVLAPDPYTARMSREHNDANVLCLGGRSIGPGAAVEIVRAWLGASVSSDERHERRRTKVNSIEQNGSATSEETRATENAQTSPARR